MARWCFLWAFLPVLVWGAQALEVSYRSNPVFLGSTKEIAEELIRLPNQLNHGKCLIEKGAYKAGEFCLRKLLSARVEIRSEALYYLGRSAQAQKQYALAAEYYQAADFVDVATGENLSEAAIAELVSEGLVTRETGSTDFFEEASYGEAKDVALREKLEELMEAEGASGGTETDLLLTIRRSISGIYFPTEHARVRSLIAGSTDPDRSKIFYIGVMKGSSRGIATLIAPGVFLTCAHVAKAIQGRESSFSLYQGREGYPVSKVALFDSDCPSHVHAWEVSHIPIDLALICVAGWSEECSVAEVVDSEERPAGIGKYLSYVGGKVQELFRDSTSSLQVFLHQVSPHYKAISDGTEVLVNANEAEDLDYIHTTDRSDELRITGSPFSGCSGSPLFIGGKLAGILCYVRYSMGPSIIRPEHGSNVYHRETYASYLGRPEVNTWIKETIADFCSETDASAGASAST